jgi:hypothetical protein
MEIEGVKVVESGQIAEIINKPLNEGVKVPKRIISDKVVVLNL